jgi:hypothetical protein
LNITAHLSEASVANEKSFIMLTPVQFFSFKMKFLIFLTVVLLALAVQAGPQGIRRQGNLNIFFNLEYLLKI